MRVAIPGIEFGFDRSALAFEDGDHLPTRFEDQRVEGLFEARLLDGDRFRQLPPSCRQSLQDLVLDVRQGAQFMGHRMSKARNQAGVQLVGLGDQALGVAKRLDAPRIDQENLHPRLDQRHGQLARIAADRLDRHLARAALPQGGEDGRDPCLRVGRPDRLGEGMKAKVEPKRTDVNAGRRRQVIHGEGPVLYAGASFKRPVRLSGTNTRIRDPARGRTRPSLVAASPDEYQDHYDRRMRRPDPNRAAPQV
jgi:hypothetical protein